MHPTRNSQAVCTIANSALTKTNHWLAYFGLALLFLSLAPQSLHAAAVTKRYAYVVESAGNQIGEYSITTNTGALVALAGCPAQPALTAPTSAEVNPTGQFLYVANRGANNIAVYTINALPVPTQGCLTFVGFFATAAGPFSIGVDNLYVYVSEPAANQIEGFPIANFANGALGPAVAGSPFATPTPVGLAIDSAAPYLYVANNLAAGTITAFTRLAGGTLAPIGPFATGGFPTQVAVDPVEQFVFVIYPNFVESYPILPGIGALGAPNAPVATGAGPLGLAVSRFGQLAYVANNAANTVSSYLVNNATGQAAVNGIAMATAAGPFGATVEQQGKYLYIADIGANSVSGYTINPNTGILKVIPGSPWPTGAGPIAIATQP
jgi:6-phosphogluconolactonase